MEKTKPIKCKQCGLNYSDFSKCLYHPGTYTLFYKKDNKTEVSEIYKYNCCNRLIGSIGCTSSNYHII